MKEKILIVDDDRKLNIFYVDYLSEYGYDVHVVTHPIDGLDYLKKNRPHLIILDVMLPDMDGFELCKKIRKEYDIPIIMSTAKGEVIDRVVELEIGADDYIPKPFEPRELVARIQALLRRSYSKQESQQINIDNLQIDFNQYSVKLNDEIIDITTTEFEILKILVLNRGIVLSRDQIMDELKGFDWDPTNRSVDMLISRLRQKLNDDPKKPKYIKTIRNTGYLFVAENDK